jgi:hypothetical protein
MDGELPSGGKIALSGAGSTLHGMECVSVVPGTELSDRGLELFLAELSEGRFGRVMRGKGFFPVHGKGCLNLQVVAGRIALEPFTANADFRLTLIGYGLDGERLRAFFSAEGAGKEEQ